MSTSTIIRRVKLQSIELAVLRAPNADEIHSEQWNPAPCLLYTAERGDDAVLCIERLLDCDHPPLQTVSNAIDYIRQALEVVPHLHPPTPNAERAKNAQGLCLFHEHKIAHCAYGDPNDVMMYIGCSSSAGFDRIRLPVRYYLVSFSCAQELPREADLRGVSFCRDVCDLRGHVPDARRGGEYLTLRLRRTEI